jgi:ribosomal protein S18 acetylase RimI-like enzyme
VIRRAEGRDAASLAALLRALNTKPGSHPARITAQGVARDLIGDARVVLLVAEGDGMAQGFVSGHPFYDSGASRWGFTMSDLYVAPEARRRGLGRALLAALAHAAAEDGGEFLRWDADEGDALALVFHRGIGASEKRAQHFLIEGQSFTALLAPT